MDSTLFANVLVIVLLGSYTLIKQYYVKKLSTCMSKLVALLNTDNVPEMKKTSNIHKT